jgi:hypothetical protein
MSTIPGIVPSIPPIPPKTELAADLDSSENESLKSIQSVAKPTEVLLMRF